MNGLAGETGFSPGAEGATAPETLRHQGPPGQATLWKAALFLNWGTGTPKE